MTRLFLAALTLCLVAGVASAADISCSVPSPITVDSSTSFSCGGLTFSNFLAAPAGLNTTAQVNIVAASYSSNGLGADIVLNLNPNLAVSMGSADVQLWYTVTSVDPTMGVNQVDLSLSGHNATVDETVCSSPIPTSGADRGVCASGLLSSIAASGGSTHVVGPTFVPTNTVYIYKDIQAHGTGNDNPGSITTLNQSYSITGLQSEPGGGEVPEPASMLMLGTGLVGAGLLRRLKKAKS